MKKKTVVLPLLAAFVACAVLATAGCSSSTPVVKKVDHVTVWSPDAGQLFTTFTQKLGLPVAWPFSTYPQFATGGAGFGNVNVESIEFFGPGGKPEAPPMAFTYGVVFEPVDLAKSVPVLAKQGAEPAKPVVQYRDVNGQKKKMWTNVTLGGLSQKDYTVYLCQYEPGVKPKLTPAPSSGLGGIGLKSMKEITIMSTDPQALQAKWSKALLPTSTSGSTLSFGTGPAVTFVKGNAEAIKGMVLQVASLEKAKAFLEKNGMLGSASSSQISIKPESVQGLDILITQ